MTAKQALMALVLAVVIVGALFFAHKRMKVSTDMPDAVRNRPIERMDMKSFEIITEPYMVWFEKYPPDALNRFINPKTGQHTMVDYMICAHCGKKIPVPTLSDDALTLDEAARTVALDKLQREYVCPYCKQSPFPQPNAPR